jgi:hypothetical protein
LKFPGPELTQKEFYEQVIFALGFPGRASSDNCLIDMFSGRFKNFLNNLFEDKSVVKSCMRMTYRSAFFGFKEFVGCFGSVISKTENYGYFAATHSSTNGMSEGPVMTAEGLLLGFVVGAIKDGNSNICISTGHPGIRAAYHYLIEAAVP